MSRPVLSLLAVLSALALRAARLSPDYAGIVLPPNIAPLNFRITDPASASAPVAGATARLTAPDGSSLDAEADGNGVVQWPARGWRRFLTAHAGESVRLDLLKDDRPFFTTTNRISRDRIDACLTYRLIPPSYRFYGEITIRQRSLETFDERTLFSNRQTTLRTCVNCHTYNRADPGEYLFHTRAFHAGTHVVSRKYGRLSFDFSACGLIGNPVYPAWHPSGDFIAFSVNETRQNFYEMQRDRVEVFDLQSDLALLSLADRKMHVIENAPETFETYPAWSPDGLALFTARARTGMRDVSGDESDRYGRFEPHFHEIFYDLVMRTFDPKTCAFSEPQLLIDALKSGKSVTLPRVSPDGRWIVLSIGPYGCFHIWHRDSDLWIYDRQKQTLRFLGELNSRDSESYHTFSRDGTWMVFSTRRDDGAYTRPYFAHFDAATGTFSKPFILPARHPDDHARRLFSYNIPEFSTGTVRESRRDLRELVESAANKTRALPALTPRSGAAPAPSDRIPRENQAPRDGRRPDASAQ